MSFSTIPALSAGLPGTTAKSVICGALGHCQIHPNHLPVDVQKRTAGISRIDRRVSLNDFIEPLRVAESGSGGDISFEAGNNSLAHGISKFPQRISDGDHS